MSDFLKLLSLGIILIFAIIPVTYADSGSQDVKFFGKGTVSKDSGIAAGRVVWTMINGNNATYVFHGTSGLEVIRLKISPDPVCDQAQFQICLDGNVTKLKDPDSVFTVGGQVKINIHPNGKQETVGFVTGFLKDMLLQIDLTKIWSPGV